MEAQFEMLSEMAKNGDKLNFGQDFFVKFYQAFLYSDRWQQYFKGVGTTLLVTAIALVLGVVLGAIVAMVRVGYAQRKPPPPQPDPGCAERRVPGVCHGHPRHAHDGAAAHHEHASSSASSRNFTMVGALALGINSGAYVSEIIRGGLMAVDPGQMEAGRSLGLNYDDHDGLRSSFPQAIQGSILPALGNEFIMLLKDSSLISGHRRQGAAVCRPGHYEPYLRSHVPAAGRCAPSIWCWSCCSARCWQNLRGGWRKVIDVKGLQKELRRSAGAERRRPNH